MQTSSIFLSQNRCMELLTKHTNSQQRTAKNFHIVFVHLNREVLQANLLKEIYSKIAIVHHLVQENNLHSSTMCHKFFRVQDVLPTQPIQLTKDYRHLQMR